MPLGVKILSVLVALVTVSACQQRPHPMPVSFVRSVDGSLSVEVPICAGDVLQDVSVGAKFGSLYRRTGNGAPDRRVESDQVITLDLGVDSLTSGSLTHEFPPLNGPSLQRGTPFPDDLAFGVDTANYSVFVVLSEVDPQPGRAILVTGSVDRANESTSLRDVGRAEAETTIANWCSDER